MAPTVSSSYVLWPLRRIPQSAPGRLLESLQIVQTILGLRLIVPSIEQFHGEASKPYRLARHVYGLAAPPFPGLRVAIRHRKCCTFAMSYRWNALAAPFWIKIVYIEIIAGRRLAYVYKDCSLGGAGTANIRQFCQKQHGASVAFAGYVRPR